MNKIADYDTLDYDYSTYWKERDYENRAEHILLNRLFKNSKGKWFIDIGGSFGRLTDTYYNQFEKPVIIDYSLKTLQKNREHLLKQHPNLELIAANAYKLPFKDGTFDGGLMVRVLHHIDKPLDFFKELERVLNGEAIYVQEIANKVHIKARIRAILKGDFSLFNKDPYQQPKKGNDEGAKKNTYVPFLNFHPRWTRERLNEGDLRVTGKYGCSFYRIPFLKRVLGSKLLSLLESFTQILFSWSNIPPSVFFKVTKDSHVKTDFDTKLDVILACPKCHGDLKFSKDKAVCTECKKEFSKDKDIWDFRV